jgi:hypothetical protein
MISNFHSSRFLQREFTNDFIYRRGYMKYAVHKQYERGNKILCAQFDDLNDARLFIDLKLAEDLKLKVKIKYFIIEYGEIIEEFEAGQVGSSTASPNYTATDQGSQGAGSGASFRPTPFNTAPRPTGTAPRWLKEDNDKEEK